MSKLALISYLGDTDKGVKVLKKDFESVGHLYFNSHMNKKDVSIHSFLKELKRLKLEPTEVAMDLLIIACSMYAADTRISRMTFAEDSWTRQIQLFIPVSNISVWNAQRNLLESIFKFLTGDIWSISFRQRTDANLVLSPRGVKKSYGMPYKTDTVCLFSGGLDSFIGSINLLEGGVRPLLVGHAKSADVSPNQKACDEALIKHYKNQAPKRVYAFIRIPKTNLFNSEDHNERGRSFLFLALGAICASTLSSSSKLVVPENGLISLNIPLTQLRNGSHSTRTTHPFYFQNMQELFNSLNFKTQIVNPFQFMTKGEMMLDCVNKNILTKTNTMSCSSPSGRFRGMGNSHCGYCVPCIIRKAAYKKAKLKDRSIYRTEILNGKALQLRKAEGDDVIAFKYMIERLKKNPDYLKSAIRLTGPLGADVINYLKVYSRGLSEVEVLLKNVKVK